MRVACCSPASPAEPNRPLRSAAGRTTRAEEGLAVLYDLPRSQCLEGRFIPASRSSVPDIGALRKLTNATECLNGVGVGICGGDGDERLSAALLSDGEIAPMLDTVRSKQKLEVL